MFYDNYKRECNRRGVTPSGAAVACGINAARPSNWKKTGTLPKQDELRALAAYLGCDVSAFFADEPRVECMANDMPAREGGDVNEEAVVDVYRRCSKAQRARLMALVFQFEEDELGAAR